MSYKKNASDMVAPEDKKTTQTTLKRKVVENIRIVGCEVSINKYNI